MFVVYYTRGSNYLTHMYMNETHIPFAVPKRQEKEYLKNLHTATRGTGRFMMFAADQKVEHLNDDFVGQDLPVEVADPEHYFKIASQAHIGVMATQIGLISLYGRDYPGIPYLVKMNSKTNLMKTEYKDPLAVSWTDLQQVLELKEQTGLNIVGVGYTIYIGSWYESEMFHQAARLVHEAHKHGLIAALWMYPRGQAVRDEKNMHLLAGASGVAACLGADFAKVNYPYADGADSATIAEQYREVVAAAGRTGVICVGGSKKDPKIFLQNMHDQIHIAGTRGVAVGRNIYQRTTEEAVRMANAIAAVSMYDYSIDDAVAIFQGSKELDK